MKLQQVHVPESLSPLRPESPKVDSLGLDLSVEDEIESPTASQKGRARKRASEIGIAAAAKRSGGRAAAKRRKGHTYDVVGGRGWNK